MNMVEVKAVCRKELNTGIMTEASAQDCPRFLDLALISGPVNICWKYKLRANKGVICPFPHTLKVGKTRHCQKPPERSLGRILLAHDRADIWLSGD